MYVGRGENRFSLSLSYRNNYKNILLVKRIVRFYYYAYHRIDSRRIFEQVKVTEYYYIIRISCFFACVMPYYRITLNTKKKGVLMDFREQYCITFPFLVHHQYDFIIYVINRKIVYSNKILCIKTFVFTLKKVCWNPEKSSECVMMHKKTYKFNVFLCNYRYINNIIEITKFISQILLE